jgi:flagellar basal body-associated protein FliL
MDKIKIILIVLLVLFVIIAIVIVFFVPFQVCDTPNHKKLDHGAYGVIFKTRDNHVVKEAGNIIGTLFLHNEKKIIKHIPNHPNITR